MTPSNPPFIPPEVALSQQVRGCRDCQFMWPQDPASSPGAGQYGLVPVTTDWQRPDGAKTWPGTVQAGFPDPAVLTGCRKAPVMTIGINPNLQSFFNVPGRLPSGTGGGYFSKMVRSVYPAFASDAQYAAHYRYFVRDEHQLQMMPEDWVACQAETVQAPMNATLCGERDPKGRQLRYLLRPDGSSGSVDQAVQVSWGARENFSVFMGRVKQGQVFAGKTNEASLSAKRVTLESRAMTYHQRIQALFEPLGLLPGEDVSMHDMIACATPGWKSDYSIDRDELKANCQQKPQNQYLQRQVVQSRPALICFSGKEPYQVFFDMFRPFITGGPSLDEWRGDVFRLMQLAADKPVLLRMPTGSQADSPMWECRLFPMPHFSYANNYEPHARFQRQEWSELNRMIPGLEQALVERDRHLPPEGAALFKSMQASRPCPFPNAAPWEKPLVLQEAVYALRLNPADALSQVGGLMSMATEPMDAARAYVQDRWVDPAGLLKKVMDDLTQAGQVGLQTDPPVQAGAGALRRSTGGCSYCTHHQLPKGCQYPSVPRSTPDDAAAQQHTLNTHNTQKGI